eukprot:CAMPEP_0176266850 /NCGR_PEP_ID=MMETSP0121_2-20121125/42858_1 /TAXON_ID=160619 /ORGANISM="Kryptoperidinium foliaceum, Strain CCMP 1326" /LENGTH=37 /DNA_ID= /DNA_START= /DNA_END= /DNA_ORIENTATION=
MTTRRTGCGVKRDRKLQPENTLGNTPRGVTRQACRKA